MHTNLPILLTRINPMELRSAHTQDTPMVSSVLHGEGFCINRILSRESSVGQSSRIYYRSAKGIPFKWELQPGTPKEPQEDDIMPPLSPSPLMQSLGLPLPNVDSEKADQGPVLSLKRSRIWSLKEMVKKRISILDVNNKDSSFSSVSTSSLSESSFSSNSRVLDSSVVDVPFCCGLWNVPAVLVEDNTKVYYCSHHKTTFTVEEDGSYVTRILSRFPSSDDQFLSPLHDETAPAGVPFRWEMQPGTPKRPPENGLIPPPSPPPAAQSLGLPRPHPQPWQGKNKKTVWARAWNWIRVHEKKKRGKNESEISFRRHENMEICSCDEEIVKRKCYNWSRRDVLSFTRRQFKSLTF